MFLPIKKALALALALGGTAVAAGAVPSGSTGTPVDRAPTIPAESNMGITRFGEIPTTVPGIVVAVEDTKVKIRRASDVSSIVASSASPSHWNVSGNVIRQVVQSSPQKGTTLRADAGGAQITLNGKIYQLPRDSDGAIRSLKVENGVVTINGKKLDPLPGAAAPGVGPATLEIAVPDTYKGGLTISSQGNSRVEVESWKNGPLTVNVNGTSTFTAGDLSQLEKTHINVNGGGSAQVSNLSTKTLVANIDGSGAIVVKNGKADISNATVSGTGMMRLKGSYKNLQKAIEGSGMIDVQE